MNDRHGSPCKGRQTPPKPPKREPVQATHAYILRYRYLVPLIKPPWAAALYRLCGSTTAFPDNDVRFVVAERFATREREPVCRILRRHRLSRARLRVLHAS